MSKRRTDLDMGEDKCKSGLLVPSLSLLKQKDFSLSQAQRWDVFEGKNRDHTRKREMSSVCLRVRQGERDGNRERESYLGM